MKDLIEKMEAKVTEAGDYFQQCKQALDSHYPAKLSAIQSDLEKAEAKIQIAAVGMCSSAGRSGSSSLVKYLEEAVRHKLLLEVLPKAEVVLRERFEEALRKVNSRRLLLSEVKYFDLRDQLVTVGRAVDRKTRSQLVGLVTHDATLASEAHRICDALDEHSSRNARLGESKPFKFETRSPVSLRSKIEAL